MDGLFPFRSNTFSFTRRRLRALNIFYFHKLKYSNNSVNHVHPTLSTSYTHTPIPKIISSPSRPRLITFARQIYLHRSLNSLNDSKEYSDYEKRDRYPESIPPKTIPPIVPPLRQCRRARLIEHLLQYDQTIVPIVEMPKSELVSLDAFAFCQLRVDFREGL